MGKQRHNTGIVFIFLWTVFCFCFHRFHVAAIGEANDHVGDFARGTTEDDEDGNLLTKIDCKLGDRYEYLMATQSSLLDLDRANLMIKVKLELRCAHKRLWHNRSSGALINGQIFEAQVTAVAPSRISPGATSNSGFGENKPNGAIQMASLFASLDNLQKKSATSPGAEKTGEREKNLKIGAVNTFFSDFAKSFGEMIKEFFAKLIKFFESLLKRKINESAVRRSADPNSVGRDGFSWTCRPDNAERRSSRRVVRSESGSVPGSSSSSGSGSAFANIDFVRLGAHLRRLFEHPFTFMQLEDGSIRDISLAANETTNAAIRNFKHFLAHSFATQLDANRRVVRENDTLGDHMSRYEIEYDEPDRGKVTPEQYIAKVAKSGEPVVARNRRIKRSSHLVSVIRTVNSADMFASSASAANSNSQMRHKTIDLAALDFSAQQVQLVDQNMLIASGGYFRTVVPIELQKLSNDIKNDDDGGVAGAAGAERTKRNVKNANSTNGEKSENFDQILQQYLTLNLEYSMVRTKPTRWRRSANFEEAEAETSPNRDRAIRLYIAAMKRAAKSVATIDINRERSQRRKRRSTSTSASTSSSKKDSKNVVCREIPNPDNIDNIIFDDNTDNRDRSNRQSLARECYEYRQIGSRWLNAYYNRSIVTKSGSSAKPEDNIAVDRFETRYRVGARMLGEPIFMGEVEIGGSGLDSAAPAPANGPRGYTKFRINLFGSEYVDLDLCSIRDRTFSQANAIPLFAQNLWFMTDVAVKIRYDLRFRIEVPDAVCPPEFGLPTAETNMDTNPNANNNNGNKFDNNSATVSRMFAHQVALRQNAKIDLDASFDASFLIFNGAMNLNGNFDMDSNIDFSRSCLSARSTVRPTNISVDFNYKFFHPLCGEWMEDRWIPRQLRWTLDRPYQNSWFDDVCV